MSVMTRSAFQTQVNTDIADNTSGDISPADLRKQLNDVSDSVPFPGDNITGGFTSTAFDAGTKSSGTFTPVPASGNIQKAVNGGAHTLAPPSADCCIVIQYTNNATAGAITTSGFTWVDGNPITTTNGHDFFFFITRVGTFSLLTVKALQ